MCLPECEGEAHERVAASVGGASRTVIPHPAKGAGAFSGAEGN